MFITINAGIYFPLGPKHTLDINYYIGDASFDLEWGSPLDHDELKFCPFGVRR